MAKANPMRVLIVGIGALRITFLERLVNGLANEGVQVTLATRTKPPKGRFHPLNVNWLWTPSWDGSIFTRSINLFALLITKFLSPRNRWLLNNINKQETVMRKIIELYRLLPFMHKDWDVIYFTWNSAAIGYKALYQLGIPVVVSCRGSQVNIRPYLPGNEDYAIELTRSLKDAKGVHCVSQDILDNAKEFGLEPNKAVVIHPAVDPDFFFPPTKKTSNNRLLIISTGSLIWLKGYEYALMAIRHLIDKGLDIEFHIIGDGPERQRILYTVQDLGLEGRVVLHGRLSPEIVREHLQQADIFLLSSLSEGISNAVLEAMSCGQPIVTTDSGGMREAITDGVEGFIVPVRDPQAMAMALEKLALDPGLRQRMGKAGRDRIENEFELGDQVRSFIKLFSMVVKKSL